MSVTYDVLFEVVKTVMHELEEEIKNDTTDSSLAYLGGAAQAISRVFDCLLISNCRSSQIMQGLVVAESIHNFLSLWLKKNVIEVHTGRSTPGRVSY